MSRKETVGLFVAGIIFAIVLAGVLLLKLIDTAQAIQIVLSFVLVLVTVIYVKRTADIAEATKEQAAASVKMAKEMSEQRYDAVRPVIDIRSILYTKIGQDILFDDLVSRGVDCTLHNIGLGPAIDVYSCIQSRNQQGRNFNFGTLATGGETATYPLSLNQEGNQWFLAVFYKDVYDRHFKSTREVQIAKEKGDSRLELGPLKIHLIEELTK